MTQHVVPGELKEAFNMQRVKMTDYTIARLSHAEKAKTLLAKQKSGVLSTTSAEDGIPFGSIINFALDADGTIFFFASKLAEHTTNLDAHPNASLFVYEEKADKEGDQLAVSRATIVGNLVRIEKTPELIDTFQLRHPGAQYVRFDDFSVFKFDQVLRVRYIAGFGEMSWIGADAFQEAKIDTVLIGSMFAVEHMNKDHADANVQMANRFGNLSSPCTSASMFSIDRLGLDIVAETEEGKRLVRILFPEPLEDAKQIRHAVVALTKLAQNENE